MNIHHPSRGIGDLPGGSSVKSARNSWGCSATETSIAPLPGAIGHRVSTLRPPQAGSAIGARWSTRSLGAVSEFEKANLVAKLNGARDRLSATQGRRIEGRKGYAETSPELIREARRLARRSPKTGKARSLRAIAAELAKAGFTTAAAKAFSASQVQRLLGA